MRGSRLLFQDLDDQRVADFFRLQNFHVTFLSFGKPVDLGSDVAVAYLKNEFIESALSVRAGDVHILNLNDCNVGIAVRAREIHDAVGPCDILLTQFSYAARKGGRDNRAWRVVAAQEKLENIRVQADVLKPKMIIPYSSFVSFAHTRNAYLNDAANTPDADVVVQIMPPGDVTDGAPDPAASAAACDW